MFPLLCFVQYTIADICPQHGIDCMASYREYERDHPPDRSKDFTPSFDGDDDDDDDEEED